MSDSQPRDSERQSDLAVMDANEYKQKRRLERILDVMDNVEEKADEAWELFVAGEITHDAKNVMILRAVKKAIREAYNLLDDHHQTKIQAKAQTDGGEVIDYWMGDGSDSLGQIDFQTREPIDFTGLIDVLEANQFYRETWEEVVKERNAPARKEQKSQEMSVPEEVSWNAFLRLKKFLNVEHDLEIQFEELDNQIPTWGFEEVEDYDPAEDPSLPQNWEDGEYVGEGDWGERRGSD